MAVDDNGPIIAGVTWFLTFFSGGFLALRLYAKTSRQQGLWWDDHILIFSWILLLINGILTQVGQNLGFGKHIANIPIQNLPAILVGTSVGASISCFASTLSKISFGVTLLRLTNGPLRIFVWFCIITLFVVMLPSALLTWISCRPLQKTWDSSIEGECWDPRMVVNYGIFNAAWCAAADFALALIPWKLVWGLQLGIREKVGVAIAMSMGILSGVCAIVKGIYLVQLRQQDFFYNGKDLTIWTAVEIATAIIGASIPILRVFFKNTMASLRNESSPTRDKSHSQSKTTSFPLSTLSSRRGVAPTSRLRTSDSASEWSILREAEDSGAVIDEEGSKHGGILQTSTVTVTVEYEGRSEFVRAREKGVGATV